MVRTSRLGSDSWQVQACTGTRDILRSRLLFVNLRRDYSGVVQHSVIAICGRGV